MAIFCWCLMPSHVYLFRDRTWHPTSYLEDLSPKHRKRYKKETGLNNGESRSEWLQWMFERAGSKTSNVKHGMFWQHHNKPIELLRVDVIEQKANYIHNNSVERKFW